MRGHEAHHILCVASVTGKITTNADIEPIVQATKWCVNKADNMIALPLWAHTLTWYVDMTTGDVRETTENGRRIPTVDGPPFKNLAQHDYDHGKYIEDVDANLEKIVDQVIMQGDAHKDSTKTLDAKLNGIIGNWEKTLKKSDTHKSWEDGMNGVKDWYKPFSMAASPSPRVFPLGSNRLAKKIKEIVDALAKVL